LPIKGRKLGSIDCLLKRIRKTDTIMFGYQAAADRVERFAVEDLVLSQDKPQRR